MAFLCPVRIRRSKKKKPLDDESLQGPAPSMGRITGSASIETLVRVGIEKENGLGPESKMVVLHDFTPCVDDELEVKRGQIVHVLYQENDWVYVISEDNQEGFIPHSYCAQYGSQLATLALNVKKKLPRSAMEINTNNPPSPLKVTPPVSSGLSSVALTNVMAPKPSFTNPPDVLPNGATKTQEKALDSQKASQNGAVNHGMENSDSESFQEGRHLQVHASNHLMSETSSQPDIHPFYKSPSGRYVVLYSYAAQDENDLSVERGQCVTVMNTDDPDWFWVRRFDQQEGFVPSGFIYPLDAIQRQQGFSTGPPNNSVAYNQVVSQNFSGCQGMPMSHSRQNPSSHNTTWNGGSAGSSGPPSFTNPHSGLNQLNFSPNNFATAVVPPSQKGVITQNPGVPMVSPTGITAQVVPLGPGSQNGLPSADLSYNGTELVVLYDYKAQAPDDLTVRRGDWVYADLNNQTVDGWLWAYAPKTRKYGFIPKAYAKPPAMTSL